MAKKTVASLQKGEGRTYSKVIKMVKSQKPVLICSKKKWCPMTPLKMFWLSNLDYTISLYRNSVEILNGVVCF